jgi:hypothetical protein
VVIVDSLDAKVKDFDSGVRSKLILSHAYKFKLIFYQALIFDLISLVKVIAGVNKIQLRLRSLLANEPN